MDGLYPDPAPDSRVEDRPIRREEDAVEQGTTYRLAWLDVMETATLDALR